MKAETQIEIYRFGRYVNRVEDKREVVRKWIIANCPYYEGGDVSIPPTTSYEECMRIAEDKDFAFRRVGVEDKKPAHVTMARLDKILSSVKIQDVAARMVEVTKRGNNYILNCPFCGAEKVMYISPKHQIYKCFGCGKTGNVINFVMEITGKSYEQALKYIETNFVIE